MSSWLHQLVYGNPSGPSTAQQTLDAQLTAQGKTSGDATARYLKDQSAFDPEAAFQTYAKGAGNQFNTMLARQLRDFSGAQVGAGRFDSGYFTEDSGKLATDLASQFTNQLDAHALEAAGLKQRGIDSEAQFAEFQQQDLNDLASGTLDRETADRNSRRQYKASILGGLFKAGGQIAGAIAGV